MNIFRLIGDLLHLLSILLLWRKIRSQKSCAGISLKSLELYLLVFVTRYLDLFMYFISLYNTLMKIFYICATAALIYLVRVTYRATYDKAHDVFRYEFLVVGSLVLALVWNEEFTPTEILWAFSIFLESVAIVPQLWLLQQTKEVETLTADYVGTLGLYRAFYIINWLYRYFFDDGMVMWIVWVAGALQTIIYIDFLYLYVKRYDASDGGARYASCRQ